MRSERPSLRSQTELAAAIVRDFFTSELSGIPLTASELRSLYPLRAFVAGFRTDAEFDADRRRMDLLLPSDFPFAPPRVALVDRPRFQTWPHIEKDGLICLLPSTAAVDATNPVGQVRNQLAEATELIAACLRGELREDFQDEFSSYWNSNCAPNAPNFLSLIAPQPPSRELVLWRGAAFYVIADEEQTLRLWLNNRFGSDNKRRIGPAWLFWLPEPLFPDQYPETAVDVARLVSHVEDAPGFLEAAARKLPTSISIIFGARSKNGPCFAGVKIPAPASTGNGAADGARTAKGFRPGRVPPSVASTLYWHRAAGVLRSEVVRVDAAWVHGRGMDPRQAQLATTHVMVIGCGSVGSQVAVSLSMAGVGRLTLIDPERLTMANAGRHPLGVNHAGDYKAEAIALALQRRFPHHQFDAQNTTWQAVLYNHPALLKSASLIVSTTGDWNSESQLNCWHLDNDKNPPLVYGWTEPYACAGHAVAILKGGDACFACGFNVLGSPHLRVALWSGSTVRQEPGCGAIFQPYGPTELSHTTTLVGELVLDVLLDNLQTTEHRIWACREQFLHSVGGTWSNEWSEIAKNHQEGSFILRRPWPTSECLRCRPYL